MEESIDNFKADLEALIDKYNIALNEHDQYIHDDFSGYYYTVVIYGVDTGRTMDEFLADFGLL